jgi:hypothetical protein
VKNRIVIAVALMAGATAQGFAGQKPNLGAKPPRHAVVLFSGTDASQWHQKDSTDPAKWDIVDGCLVVKPGTGDIVSNRQFGDYRLHLEFWLPLLADKTSQERANSGVFNHGVYEIQVLDSYQNPTYKTGGCGAIYGQKDPDQNAIIPPEQWNSYDITFRAPRFDKDGKETEFPRITVIHNGIKIHDNVEIKVASTITGQPGPQPAMGPIELQDHGAHIKYRNIWVVPLTLK